MEQAVFWASIVKDIVTGLCTVFATLIAYQGLSNWRRQTRGNFDFELSRRLLRSAYQVRDAIASVRNPLITAEEFRSAAKEVAPDESQQKNPHAPNDDLDSEAVYQVRWNVVQKAIRDFDVESQEAEVVWGPRSKDAVKPLRLCARKLFINIRKFLQKAKPGYELDRGTRRAVEEIVYDCFDEPENDKFSNEIRSALKTIEDLVGPHLRR